MAVSDLEQAGHSALLKIRALRERMGEAKEDCEESEDRVDKWRGTLEADVKALRDAVEQLGQAAETKTQELVDEVAEAEVALGEVVAAAAEAGAQGQHLLHAEAEADGALAQQLDEVASRVTALAEAAETASKHAIDRAGEVADVLAEATQNLEQILNAFASVLDETAHDVETTATAVLSLIDDLAPSLLADEDKEFEEKTGEARQLIDRHFPGLNEHATAVADYSVETFEKLLDAVLDAIEPEERELETALEGLTDLAQDKEREIVAAGDDLAARLGQNVAGAQTLEQALAEIRTRWLTFGFTV